MVDVPEGARLLIACDAAGGIGPKPMDAVRAPGYVLGRLTARVALAEVIAAGGRPLALVNTCCVAPEPDGEEILGGILDEAALAGLGPDAVTGSFEKNIPTVQTGLGVTALAVAARAPGRARPGDLVVAVGRPKVGPEVDLGDRELPDLPLLLHLRDDAAIHDLLPVGSRGIAAEVAELAGTAGLRAAMLTSEPGWDLHKSAGPATTLLLAIAPQTLPALALTLDRPWAVVAHLDLKSEEALSV
jgi:hypothetical protein